MTAKERDFWKDRASCAERLLQIGELTRLGWTGSMIAERLDVGLSTVRDYRRRVREGWEPRGSGADQKKTRYDDPGFGKRVAELYGSGLSMARTAAVLGVSSATVYRAVHAHGIPVRSRVRPGSGSGAVNGGDAAV